MSTTSLGKKEIDDIDARLIKELLINGRANFSMIAKQCQTSECMIGKRYRELEAKGIIVGSTIQLNYPRIGYDFVGNIFFKVEPQLVDQATVFVRRMPNVHAVWRTAKTSEINVIVIMEKLETLEDLKDRIRKIPSTSELRTYIWIRIRNIRDNLAILPTERFSSRVTATKNHATNNRTIKSKVDHTDRKIIEKLALNGRLSFRKLAKELTISTDTVSKRYKKMERNGIIKTLIQLDLAKLGYHGYATFYIALGSQSVPLSMIENICQIPDIVLIIQTSGNFDLLVEAMVRDLDQLLSIQDQLTNIPGVVRCEMHVNTPTPIFPTPCEYISTF